MSADRSSPPEIVAQQAAIAQVGQRALEERSLAILLPEACELIARVLGAEMTSITELTPDGTGLRVVAGTGWRPGTVGALVLGAGSQSMAGHALAQGEPVLVEDFASESRFAVAESLRDHGAASGVTVRVGGATHPYGTLAAFSTRPHRFTPDDINFVHAVANVLAAAVDRLEIEAELRASRDELSAIVAGIDDGITVQDATGRLVYANDAAAQLSGYPSAAELLAAPIEDVIGRFELVHDDGQPLAPTDLPSRRALGGEDVSNMLVGFRLPARGELRWSRVSAQSIRDGQGRVVRVVNTFHEVTDERWAREARAYMADAVAILSTTLDPDEAARRLAKISVPRLADYCTVSMLQPDGSITLTAVAHAKPERLALIEELVKILPPADINATYGTGHVIREGVTEARDVTDVIEMMPLSEEQRALLDRLELRAYVTVPLTGRRGAIGALSLVMAESGRGLGEREQSLAQELGARAGIALENARLYQAAEERRAELGTVLAALVEAVLLFDHSGALHISNQAAAAMFGGHLPDSLDALWRCIRVDGEDPRGLADGEAVEAELDASGRWLELRRYRAWAGNDPESAAPTVVVLRDVTELRAASAARDAFMGVLSHELRTPVTTIYGGSELLERDLDENHRREVIADIRAESERLARLVEDLLVMTRVERGIVEIADEPILLQHLIAAVVQSSQARWPDAQITLAAADRLPAVRGDATYIEQVLRNLLTNAMRYGKGHESGIEIRAQRDGEFVSVHVLDSGEGFGGEDPEQLFELFYRTPSARAVPGGAGIGLFVCRSLIEKMGGHVWARERPEGGAEFAFSVPVLETDAAV